MILKKFLIIFQFISDGTAGNNKSNPAHCNTLFEGWTGGQWR
jgi:hypothetical protein